MASVPVIFVNVADGIFDDGITPVILEALRLVRPNPLPLVDKAPTTPLMGIFVRLTPLLDARLERVAEEG
jgi:hypothetical protein